MTKKDEVITVQIDNETIELKGKELSNFLDDRQTRQEEDKALKLQENLNKELKKSAYTKLGLTEEEINAIL